MFLVSPKISICLNGSGRTCRKFRSKLSKLWKQSIDAWRRRQTSIEKVEPILNPPFSPFPFNSFSFPKKCDPDDQQFPSLPFSNTFFTVFHTKMKFDVFDASLTAADPKVVISWFNPFATSSLTFGANNETVLALKRGVFKRVSMLCACSGGDSGFPLSAPICWRVSIENGKRGKKRL